MERSGARWTYLYLISSPIDARKDPAECFGGSQVTFGKGEGRFGKIKLSKEVDSFQATP